MNKRRWIAALVLSIALAPGLASALDTCGAKIQRSTGLVLVSATGIEGSITWQEPVKNVATPFTNPECVVDGRARRCLLAEADSAAAMTPPAGCNVQLKDDGGECVAYVRGCVPGARVVVPCMTVSPDGKNVVFEGCNVHVRNNTGTTGGETDGLGNLIIGYNEGFQKLRTGSHNLVIGRDHEFTSYAGLVAGVRNTISGEHASVTGGTRNVASGYGASVSGGVYGTASSYYASVSGGLQNTASGATSTVSGGRQNEARAAYASVSGGDSNLANGVSSSVVGGGDNAAQGDLSAISGGYGNSTSGCYSSVAGGYGNSATGIASSIAGGYGNLASGARATVAGGSEAVASASESAVSGGFQNQASAQGATVGGGANRIASEENNWVGGSLLESD